MRRCCADPRQCGRVCATRSAPGTDLSSARRAPIATCGAASHVRVPLDAPRRVARARARVGRADRDRLPLRRQTPRDQCTVAAPGPRPPRHSPPGVDLRDAGIVRDPRCRLAHRGARGCQRARRREPAGRRAQAGDGLRLAGHVACDGRRRTGATTDVVLTIDPTVTGGPDAYRLEATSAAIRLAAATAEGLFRASQTLRQLLPPTIHARVRAAGTLAGAGRGDRRRAAVRVAGCHARRGAPLLHPRAGEALRRPARALQVQRVPPAPVRRPGVAHRHRQLAAPGHTRRQHERQRRRRRLLHQGAVPRHRRLRGGPVHHGDSRDRHAWTHERGPRLVSGAELQRHGAGRSTRASRSASARCASAGRSPTASSTTWCANSRR